MGRCVRRKESQTSTARACVTRRSKTVRRLSNRGGEHDENTQFHSFIHSGLSDTTSPHRLPSHEIPLIRNKPPPILLPRRLVHAREHSARALRDADVRDRRRGGDELADELRGVGVDGAGVDGECDCEGGRVSTCVANRTGGAGVRKSRREGRERGRKGKGKPREGEEVGE